MEGNKNMGQQKRGRFAIIMLIFISVLLCAALIVTSMSFANYKQSIADQANAKPESVPQEEVVTVETLKAQAQKYNVSAEFLQQFFDDVIVYKDTQGIVYAPIDETLPKHSYDFDNLVKVGGEIQYQENGISTGIKGIDVSKHQGKIDWKKVKADGVEFALIRLGYRGYGTGKVLLDEFYEANIKGAIEAG
ncbi:MAG: GH25 family lysozyme, partial [Oscillospiraceae bacterium]